MAFASRGRNVTSVEGTHRKVGFWEAVLYWPNDRKITAEERRRMTENERAALIFKESWLWLVVGLAAFVVMAWFGTIGGGLPHALPK
jgi:hypothetical protein